MKAHTFGLLPFLALSLAAPTRNTTISTRAEAADATAEHSNDHVLDPADLINPYRHKQSIKPHPHDGDEACQLFFYFDKDCEAGARFYHKHYHGLAANWTNGDKRGLQDIHSFWSANCEGVVDVTTQRCFGLANIPMPYGGSKGQDIGRDYAKLVEFKRGCTNVDRETLKLADEEQVNGHDLMWWATSVKGEMNTWPYPLCLIMLESKILY